MLQAKIARVKLIKYPWLVVIQYVIGLQDFIVLNHFLKTFFFYLFNICKMFKNKIVGWWQVLHFDVQTSNFWDGHKHLRGSNQYENNTWHYAQIFN